MSREGAPAPVVGATETASLTDVGLQRAHNEDAFEQLRRPDGVELWMVADGMGGHAGGERASRIAVETVRAVVEEAGEASEALLRQALEEANRAIHRAATADSHLAGMGTTGVALLRAPDGRAWVAHVGDSRAYLLRGGRLEQLTEDHSFVAELQRRGVIDAREAAQHPRRNQLLRSLGIDSGVEIDVRALALVPGDRIVLCSDGLSNVVGDDDIAEIVERDEPFRAVRSLVALANDRGGPDNITVQIIHVREGPARGCGSRLGLAALVTTTLAASAWALVHA